MPVGIFYKHNSELVGFEIDTATHTMIDEHSTNVANLSDKPRAAVRTHLIPFEQWLKGQIQSGNQIYWELPVLSGEDLVDSNDQGGQYKPKRTTIVLQQDIHDQYKRNANRQVIFRKRELTISNAQAEVVKIVFLASTKGEAKACLHAYNVTNRSVGAVVASLKGSIQYQTAELMIKTFATPSNQSVYTMANYIKTLKRYKSNNRAIVAKKQAIGTVLATRLEAYYQTQKTLLDL